MPLKLHRKLRGTFQCITILCKYLNLVGGRSSATVSSTEAGLEEAVAQFEKDDGAPVQLRLQHRRQHPWVTSCKRWQIPSTPMGQKQVGRLTNADCPGRQPKPAQVKAAMKRAAAPTCVTMSQCKEDGYANFLPGSVQPKPARTRPVAAYLRQIRGGMQLAHVAGKDCDVTC